MSDDDKKPKEHDIFVANSIYPNAEDIFSASLKKIDQIVSDCYIILDTNALLVPYATGPDSLKQIRDTYKRLVTEKRLVIPGQVAREFAKQRASKLSELYKQLSDKRNFSSLQKGRYPLLEELPEYKQVIDLEREIDSKLEDYRKALKPLLDHVRGWTWNDPVSTMYRELFSKGVVFDLPLNKENIQKDLVRRQAHSIPPGYKDSAKADGGIGDLLIWHTILQVGETNSKSVVFVSGDEKADWWHQSDKQPLYPRYELVDEFARFSKGSSFHILKFSEFISLFGASKTVVADIQRGEALAKSSEPAYPENFLMQHAIFNWFNEYSGRKCNLIEFLYKRFLPTLIVADSSGYRTGIEIILARNYADLEFYLEYHNDASFDDDRVVLHAEYGVAFGSVMQVLVAPNVEIAAKLFGRLAERYSPPSSFNGWLIVGYSTLDGTFRDIVQFGAAG